MTIEPPDSLPEGWVGKPKEDYPRSRSGCTSLAALALLFAVFVVLVGMVALLIYDPNLIEKILNYPNLPQTQQALDLTAQYNRQFAADSEATRGVLSTQQMELNQRATQDALYSTQSVLIQQTQAAVARENVQMALDLQASQVAFVRSQRLTQTAVSIELTATQAANEVNIMGNLTATQLAVDIAATQRQQAINAATTEYEQNQTATANAAAVSGQPLPAATPAASQP